MVLLFLIRTKHHKKWINRCDLLPKEEKTLIQEHKIKFNLDYIAEIVLERNHTNPTNVRSFSSSKEIF